MKNNGEKLEGLMIAAMLLIFVTSIWAFRDAQRMHEKLAEKVQQTPETAEFAEFVSHYCQQRRKRQKSLHLMQVTRT